MLNCVVIGAGPAGLACTKELVENGLEDVVCVDRAPALGGVFINTYDNLILTSSVYYSVFSDFWSGDIRHQDVANGGRHFWRKAEAVQYWTDYANRYNITDRLKFNSGVDQVTETEDGWEVTLETGEVLETERIAVATGTNRRPSYPEWANELTDIPYSHVETYRNNEGFENKNVLMVGGGESGSDVAYEISKVAANSWVSLRTSAGWIVPRVRRGMATDVSTHRGVWGLPREYGQRLGRQLRKHDRSTENPVNLEAEKLNRKVAAKNGIWGTYGTKSYALPTAVANHDCKVVTEIAEVHDGGRKLVTASGEVLADVDAVVFSTGYHSSSDEFLPEKYHNIDPRSMFKHSIHPKFGDKIAWIGRARPNFGSQFPLMEMQSRLFAQVASGKMPLVDQKTMQTSIAEDLKANLDQFENNAERIRSLVDYYRYMDGTADVLGCKPPLIKYFFTNPKLWRHLVYGPTQATQYRLVGRGAKPTLAKEIIYQLPVSTFNPVVKAGLRGRLVQLLERPKTLLAR